MNIPVAKSIAAFAASAVGARLAPFTIERRPVGPRDVLIEIDYCGVCHTDLHFVNNDWGMSAFPMVPGHEIIGRVVSMGAEGTDLVAGQRAGVGCLVDSCRQCDACEDHLEQ